MATRRAEAGFTLVEVAMAVAMLAILTLGLMSMSSRMIREVTDDRQRTLASASADARIAVLRQWPSYTTLDNFAGSEADVPHSGWTRTTTIVRTGGSGQPNDYKRVQVTVQGPGLSAPVERTVTLAAP